MNKVHNFSPKIIKKNVKKLTNRYINLDAISNSYQVHAKFHEINKSFVFSHQNNKSNYENVILGSNNDLNTQQNNLQEFYKYNNISLHDYSRLFLKGEAEIDPKIIKSFMQSTFTLNSIINSNTINIELSVAPFEDKHKNACHTGWYNIIEDEGKLSLTGMLFYKLNTFADLLSFFHNSLNVTLYLSKIDKRSLDIEQYPWNRCAKTFFENKYIFFTDIKKSNK